LTADFEYIGRSNLQGVDLLLVLLLQLGALEFEGGRHQVLLDGKLVRLRNDALDLLETLRLS